jgi:hypothetical protein
MCPVLDERLDWEAGNQPIALDSLLFYYTGIEKV